MLLPRLVLLTNGSSPSYRYSCTLSLQTVREMLLYTFELKNKKVEPQVRPCVTGVGGLVCTSANFGSSKGSQCSIPPDSSTPYTNSGRTVLCLLPGSTLPDSAPPAAARLRRYLSVPADQEGKGGRPD